MEYAEARADITSLLKTSQKNYVGVVLLDYLRVMKETGLLLGQFSADEYRELVLPFLSTLDDPRLVEILGQYLKEDMQSIYSPYTDG